MSINILKGFNAIKNDYIKYYKNYTFDRPIVMTTETCEIMRLLGKILWKAIFHMNQNYLNYTNLIPRNESELKVLEICNKYPHKVGAFRTDFIIDQCNNIRIIEINAGQPLNGYFTTGFFREIAFEQAKNLGINNIIDYYSNFFNYLEKYIGDVNHITVIYGKEKPSEITIYPAIFNNAGIQCYLIPVEKLNQNLKLLENAWVIIELLFDEILALPLELIELLMTSNPHNALNTYLNAGNKRFFYVLNQPEFIEKILNQEEIELLRKFVIPTFIYGRDNGNWMNAYNNKNQYIIKHYGKGRGEDVYAGCLTNSSKWKDLFESGIIENMVLQPFIKQNKFNGRIGDEKRNDFITGTLLYFNEEFFGPGLYRTHTSPVTSDSGDFRKIAPLVAKAEINMNGIHYL